jgi:hypothetical protein
MFLLIVAGRQYRRDGERASAAHPSSGDTSSASGGKR